MSTSSTDVSASANEDRAYLKLMVTYAITGENCTDDQEVLDRIDLITTYPGLKDMGRGNVPKGHKQPKRHLGIVMEWSTEKGHGLIKAGSDEPELLRGTVVFGYYTGVQRNGFKFLDPDEVVTFELYYDIKRYCNRAINIRGIWGTEIVWADINPYSINPNVLDGLYNNDTGYLHHVPTGIFRGRAFWICAACGTETFKQRDICRGCNVVNRAEIRKCGDSVAARNEIKRRLIPQFIPYPQCSYCKKKHLGPCLHCFTCGGLHREACNESLVLKEQLRGNKQPYW